SSVRIAPGRSPPTTPTSIRYATTPHSRSWWVSAREPFRSLVAPAVASGYVGAAGRRSLGKAGDRGAALAFQRAVLAQRSRARYRPSPRGSTESRSSASLGPARALADAVKPKLPRGRHLLLSPAHGYPPNTERYTQLAENEFRDS